MKPGFAIEHNFSNDRLGISQHHCNVAFIDCVNNANRVVITYYKDYEPSFTPATVAVLRLKPKKP